MGDARGREHDVEAAKIGDGLREHRGDLRGVAHVNLNCGGLAAKLAHGSGGLLGRGQITVSNGDVGALFGEANGGGAADAAGGAGDQCVFSIEPETHCD